MNDLMMCFVFSVGGVWIVQRSSCNPIVSSPQRHCFEPGYRYSWVRFSLSTATLLVLRDRFRPTQRKKQSPSEILNGAIGFSKVQQAIVQIIANPGSQSTIFEISRNMFCSRVDRGMNVGKAVKIDSLKRVIENLRTREYSWRYRTENRMTVEDRNV
jgi:hypothetical protein